MTAATPTTGAVATGTVVPTGIRVASTLCWIVGAITVAASVFSGLPALWAIANAVAGLLVCASGFLVRRQLRVGAYLVALGWMFPSIVSLATGGAARPGPIFLLIAGFALLANWKHLR